MFVRRVIKTTAKYITYIRQRDVELAPFLALVGVVLTTGEVATMWLLSGVAPALAQVWEKTDRCTRIVVCGVFPAAVILVWGILTSGWLMLWRQNPE